MNIDEYRSLTSDERKSIKLHGARQQRKALQAAEMADHQLQEKERKATLTPAQRQSEMGWTAVVVGVVFAILVGIGACTAAALGGNNDSWDDPNRVSQFSDPSNAVNPACVNANGGKAATAPAWC